MTGNDLQTQVVITANALPQLQALLDKPKKSIKKEACWTISNITAGNVTQIQAVVEANLIPPLINLLSYADFDIKKEAAWAIANITSGGSEAQIDYLVNEGCIKPLCDLLRSFDTRTINVVLEGLENILKVGERVKGTASSSSSSTPTPTIDEDRNKYADCIEEAGGLDKIEELQSHPNQAIYEKVVRILEKYFAAEEAYYQNINPTFHLLQQTFSFGVPSSVMAEEGYNF